MSGMNFKWAKCKKTGRNSHLHIASKQKKDHLKSRLERENVVAMTIARQRTSEVTNKNKFEKQQKNWKTKQICRARGKNENHEKMRSIYNYYAA